MSLLARVLSRMAARLGPVETRRTPGGIGAFGIGASAGAGSLGTYGAHLAENLATVTACVEVIAGTLSTLPAVVYRSLPQGREEAPRHPVSALIQRPNSRQSWPDWLSMMVSQVLLYGNALSILEHDGDGRPVGLIPVPWGSVTITLSASGQLVFDVQYVPSPWGNFGERRRYLQDEVFHLKARSDDGFLGRSVLSRAPSVLNAAEGAQTFASSIWANSANPSLAIRHSARLSPEGKGFLREEMTHLHGGAGKTGKVLVLDEGMQAEKLSMSAEDSELLASRRFSGEELARLFNVPPPLVGDLSHGSFTNVETAGRFFATFCLAPWARRIEAEFSRSVFPDGDGHHLLIDLAGLQRGDAAGRWATYAIAIDKGILSVDEVRSLEGWNALPDSAGEVVPGAGGGTE